MESGAESRWAPLGRAVRVAAVIDAVGAAIAIGLCIVFGWTSRNEVMTVLLGAAAALVVIAGLGAAGTGVMIDTNPKIVAREAPLLVPTAGPFSSVRTIGLSTLLILAAVPFAAAGLVLYATA